ncbi:MAG: CoA-binding protein [Ignavibacteria bacterium]|nr:CoA-binding protein [Ignavibacteria bacterium]
MNYNEIFFENKKIAVVGVSRNKHKFGNIIFNELLKREFEPIPVNPNLEEITGKKCYKTICEVPQKVDTVITVTPPNSALKIAKECYSNGIANIWFQQGSESNEALEFCRQNEINFISGKCVLMYLEPVKSFHKFHRFFSKVFGKY